MTDTTFCHFGLFFAFLPPYGPRENQNFEKMKRTPQDIIILHTCTINDNHMMYGSRDKEHNRKRDILRWMSHLNFSDKEYEHVLNV